ncbi:MAG TPA: hypothetical protein VKG44_04165, partial [Candidatus Baltobacteraceae bacterium]|nr:hypothetical protein [Candidatus Baltobacteraceae bacterium]
VPWRDTSAYPRVELVRGKIVIDAMNPYAADGEIIELGPHTTSSEEVQKRLHGARLVKAFNTMYYKHLAENGRPGAPLERRDVIFVAADDFEAKQIISQLIEEIGFAPVDTGGLIEGGRKMQPDSPLYNRPMKPETARALVLG